MLISRVQHSVPVDSKTLGGWVEKLADAVNKHGWVNVVQDPQNQIMYPAVLSSLDAMVSNSIIVACDCPTIGGDWNNPMVDTLGVRCQIATFGFNAYSWAVCGFRECESVVAIAKELQQIYGSSSGARRLCFNFLHAQYENRFDKLSSYSNAWEVHYHGHMHPDALAYLEHGGITKFTCIPIVTWMREFRDDGLEPRFNIDIVPDGEKAVFVLTSQATDEKQIATMLKKRLPKDFLSLFS